MIILIQKHLSNHWTAVHGNTFLYKKGNKKHYLFNSFREAMSVLKEQYNVIKEIKCLLGLNYRHFECTIK